MLTLLSSVGRQSSAINQQKPDLISVVQCFSCYVKVHYSGSQMGLHGQPHKPWMLMHGLKGLDRLLPVMLNVSNPPQ